MDYLKELKLKYIKTKIKNSLRGQIKDTKQLVKLFKDLADEDKEKVVSIHLDIRAKINCFEILSIGGVEFSLVSPRELFKGIFLTNSTGFILLHNHPSGDPSPSNKDLEMIKDLEKRSKAVDLNFVDFIIIGDDGKFWSWKFKKK